MIEVLTWILILSSWDGGMLKVENIRSFEDCERLRLRAEAVKTPADRRTMTGTCTQVGIMMTKPITPVINVAVPPATPASAPIIKNYIINRKDK